MKERFIFSASKIELDGNGDLPTRVMLLQSGNWPNSIKGDFEITPEDLSQIKANFDKGVGFPSEDASTGLAIDFKHEYDDQAAAWIKGLELDTTDPKVTKLYANPVEWTDAGAAAIRGGQFKLISPSGYFGRKAGKLSAWPNPQNLKETVANVLDGAGLTNIPFLRGMSPIRADKQKDVQSGYGDVIYVYDEHKKELSMNLDALRVKEREALSVPELDFLAEQREQLSADEVAKFKVAAPEVKQAVISDEDKSVLAAVKDGSKKLVDTAAEVVDKTRLDALEKTTLDYQTEKADSIVASHIKRGAIKQDKSEFWTKQLLAVSGDARKDMEEALAALPENEMLSKEIGSSENTIAGTTAREQLSVLVLAIVLDDQGRQSH